MNYAHYLVPNFCLSKFYYLKDKSNNNDHFLRLEKLGEMKKNGIITEEEFNILKANILKKLGNVSIETSKSDFIITNHDSKEISKDSEKKKVKKYTSDGKPIYE